MIDIPQIIQDYRQKKVKIYPCHTNRASSLGHECERYLVYQRTEWDKAKPVGATLQGIFDDGNAHEQLTIKLLMDAGMELFEQQLPLGEESIFKKLNITGHIDWKIREDDKAIPIEFKSMNTFIFDAINTIEDIKYSKKSHIRRYYSQFNLYLLMTNNEKGYFLIKNKNNSMYKQITLFLDLNHAEELLKKAERINNHIDKKTIPDRIKYNKDICGYCNFKDFCNPDIPADTMYLIEDDEFIKKLHKRVDTEKSGKEFKTLDKEIKETLKGSKRDKIIAGDFLMTCKTSSNGAQKWNIKDLRIDNDE